MTVTTSAVPSFLDALCDALRARADLAGVNIYSAPVTPEDAGLESIQFDHVDETQRGQVGNTARDEQFEVTGLTYSAPHKPAGTIEDWIRAARDRVFTLLAAVEAELRINHQMGYTVRAAEISSAHLDQGPSPDGGRAAALTFTLSMHTRLPTS